MTAMLMHCSKEFRQILNTTRKNELVFDAFSALEESITKLDTIDQLEWYSAATQVLTSLAQNKEDPINPLEVFETRANFILHGKNPNLNAFGLGLSVIVIGLGTLLAAAAVGLGIGVLIGLWTTPLGFITSLIALQTAPLIIATVAPTISLGISALSSILFFKKPAVEHAFNGCVEAIKLNHLPKSFVHQDGELAYQDKNWDEKDQCEFISLDKNRI